MLITIAMSAIETYLFIAFIDTNAVQGVPAAVGRDAAGEADASGRHRKNERVFRAAQPTLQVSGLRFKTD